MVAKKSVLGLVHTGSEVRRAPLVGMQFLHQGAMSPADVVTPRARLQAKDLISLLRRHFPGRRAVDLTALPPGWQVGVCVKAGMALDYKPDCKPASGVASEADDSNEEYLNLLKQRLKP